MTINVPRLPAPFFVPTVMMLVPLPSILTSDRLTFKLFPFPAIAAVIVRTPVGLETCNVAVPVWLLGLLWLRSRLGVLSVATHCGVGEPGLGDGVGVGVGVGLPFPLPPPRYLHYPRFHRRFHYSRIKLDDFGSRLRRWLCRSDSPVWLLGTELAMAWRWSWRWGRIGNVAGDLTDHNFGNQLIGKVLFADCDIA